MECDWCLCLVSRQSCNCCLFGRPSPGDVEPSVNHDGLWLAAEMDNVELYFQWKTLEVEGGSSRTSEFHDHYDVVVNSLLVEKLDCNCKWSG